MALYSKEPILSNWNRAKAIGRLSALTCQRGKKYLISSNLKAQIYKTESTKKESKAEQKLWTNMLSQILTTLRCSSQTWDIPSFLASQAELTTRVKLKDSKENRTIKMSLLLHTGKDLSSGQASHFYIRWNQQPQSSSNCYARQKTVIHDL